ncbi:MAG: hypothetical protein K2P42_10570 [Lachnospiraceae bacterium]|nr:hypothetical protein [Lachnospiraceae bacterium]
MAKTVERQQEMIAMAKRDPLTGLRNRQGIPELVNARLRKQSGSCGRSSAGSSRLEG